MKNYNVGIIGCGAIFTRHNEAIEELDNYTMKAVCDVQPALVKSVGERLDVPYYLDYKEMIEAEDIDFIVIATPNSLHKEQSLYALENGCDILVEKPVSFEANDVTEINDFAKEHGQKAYCVLQVRFNPTVLIVQEVLRRGLLGDIRGFSYTQRWQRPLEYFSGWRGEPNVGGGTLYEVGIHYLDILQLLIGMPKEITSSKTYITKHKGGEIEDTIYAIADYGDFGGTIETTIAAEPKNIESSICLMGANGFMRIGGKALNIIESASFLSNGAKVQYDIITKNNPYSRMPNSYGSYEGSCPNHPEIYRNIDRYDMQETYNVIKMIEDIYKKAGLNYSI